MIIMNKKLLYLVALSLGLLSCQPAVQPPTAEEKRPLAAVEEQKTTVEEEKEAEVWLQKTARAKDIKFKLKGEELYYFFSKDCVYPFSYERQEKQLLVYWPKEMQVIRKYSSYYELISEDCLKELPFYAAVQADSLFAIYKLNAGEDHFLATYRDSLLPRKYPQFFPDSLVLGENYQLPFVVQEDSVWGSSNGITLKFTERNILYMYNMQCYFEFPISYENGAAVIYWADREDCKWDMMHWKAWARPVPKKGEPFARLELYAADSMAVHYYYPEWKAAYNAAQVKLDHFPDTFFRADIAYKFNVEE